MQIKGYDLHLTCGACPEQYDVFKDDEQVGYLRLRHGYFYAEYPDVGGVEVYHSSPKGDGVFYDDERMTELTKAIDAIDNHIKNNEVK